MCQEKKIKDKKKWNKCEWEDCGYEGYTHFYGGIHHCMNCNRVVK